MHICGKRPQVVLLVLLSSLSIVGFANTAHAEAYSLTVTPGRVQESNSPPILLSLAVSGATASTTYQYTFQVTDPAGNTHQANNQTTTGPTSSSFVLSVYYPTQFGTNINFVGNYTINVQQNKPTNIASVQTGVFQVGLTDKTSYQRTFPVSIKARGYASNSPITINISHDGNSAPGYPTSSNTDSAGSLSTSWTIPANTSIGTWTVSLTGTGPPKQPPDLQSFDVHPTSVTISGLTPGRTALVRTGTQQFTFTASYLSGLAVHTGSARVRLTESDGTTTLYTVANYSDTLSAFVATYRVLSSDENGIWIGTLDPNSFDDGNGNAGPAGSLNAIFTVIPATLSVVISISNSTYGPSQGIPVYALVTNPDGTVFSNGSVTADFSYNFEQLGNPLALTFVPGTGKWAGVYRVGPSDPAGLWLVTVRAADSYGNSGQQISSAVVSVPPSQGIWPGGLTTSSFLELVGIVFAASMVGFVMLYRKKAGRTEVRLDIKMLDREVDKIQASEFFQNVKRQVEQNDPSVDAPPNSNAKDTP